MDASNITAIVSVVGLALSLLLLGGGGLFWIWKLNSRVDQLTGQIQELREEIRRGHQQALQALVNHSPDENGLPVFRVPVSME